MGEVRKCIGWRGVHQFSGRYDLSPATRYPKEILPMFGVDGSVLALCEQSRQQTYVRDVCTKCGWTIERPSPPSERRG